MQTKGFVQLQFEGALFFFISNSTLLRMSSYLFPTTGAEGPAKQSECVFVQLLNCTART